MSLNSAANWYEANSDYLLLAAETVHQTLQFFISGQQNPQSAPSHDFPTFLNSAAELDPPPALEHLCNTFNLSPFERDILLLCVAQAIIPDFPDLCAQAHGKQHIDYPTLGLALKIFPHAYWSATTPDAPLQRWQLLEVEPGRTFTRNPIQIDSCILHYLMGEPYKDQRLLGNILPVLVEANEQFPLQPTHQQLAEQVALNLKFSRTGEISPSHIPLIQLCGLEAADKWAIASAACTTLQRPLRVLFAHRLPTDANSLHQLMQRWEREVALTQSVLLLNCDRVNSVDAQLETTLTQLIQEIRTPLIISTADRLSCLPKSPITYDVPKLSYTEQRAVWQANLNGVCAQLNGYVDTLVCQFNLSTPAIVTACCEVKTQQQETWIDSPIQNRLWDACRKMARPQLEDLAQRIDSFLSWDDLVLPEAQRQILRDLITHVQQRAKVYSDWGFASKSGRGLGISALFAGPSGTGKTMAAEVVARELRLDLYRIDLSTVVSKYIGETEKNLRRIFDAAEAGGAVLLFDEADALFGKRTQVKDSHDRHANVEVGYLLQRMEAYQGLAILTTNLKESLDQAFLRRIRFVVKFPFPDASQRAEIWQRIFPKQTPTAGLDMGKLAQLSVAGGNIRNIALNAAFNAADAGEPVKMKHILAAAKSEYVKLETPLTDAEIKGWLSKVSK